MATATTASTGRSAGHYVRLVGATFVVICLSGGPFVALSRWVVDEPVGFNSWPFVYTFWGAALVGTCLFFVDVVAPMTSRPIERSEILLATLAAPLALALWALLSVAWTESPAQTPGQAVLVLFVALTAVWFGYGLTFRLQVMSLFAGLQLLTIASAVLAASLDTARAASDDWVGMFTSGDSLGPVAALGIISCLGAALLVESVWLRIAIGACAVVDGVVAFNSASVTAGMSLAGAVIALAVVLLARGFGARGAAVSSIRTSATVVLTAVAVSMPWAIRLIAKLAGDDSTLHARTQIWNRVQEVVEDRWIVGFGFQSFGDDDNTVIGGSFSTFMDVLLQLGGIGLLLVLVIVALSFGRTWWEALGGQSMAMAWWVAIATFALLANATESMITTHSVFWVLLVAPAFAAMRAAASKAPSQPAGGDRLPAPRPSYTYQ